MKTERLSIPDVVLIEPSVFTDDRGTFFESFNRRQLEAILNRSVDFVQDNHSGSTRNTLRGMHYQVQQPQGKLVRVVQGCVFDVAVDLRQSSSTFGRSVTHLLSAENRHQLWIPEGFAHGFLVLSETAQFLYKTTDYYSPQGERCIAWNDSVLAIDWPLDGLPRMSEKDQMGSSFHAAELFP